MTLPFTLYEGKAGSPATSITETYTVGVDDVIKFTDVSILADAPNRITIVLNDRTAFATIFYETIAGNTVSGLTFEEGTAGTYPAGSTALRNYTHKDDWDIKRDVQYLEGAKLENTYDDSDEGKYLRVGESGVVSPVQADYNEVGNKPKINDVILEGNKTLNQLGIASKIALNEHIEDYNNPHNVTKAQVGLGQADNTADIDKPISTATQNALNAKLGTQYTSAEDGFIAKVDSSDHVLKVMRSGTATVRFNEILGEPEDNQKLKQSLDHKVNQRDGSLAFEVGEDALGTYIWT